MDSCFSGSKRGKSWKKSRLVKEKWKVDNANLNRSRIDPSHSGSNVFYVYASAILEQKFSIRATYITRSKLWEEER